MASNSNTLNRAEMEAQLTEHRGVFTEAEVEQIDAVIKQDPPYPDFVFNPFYEQMEGKIAEAIAAKEKAGKLDALTEERFATYIAAEEGCGGEGGKTEDYFKKRKVKNPKTNEVSSTFTLKDNNLLPAILHLLSAKKDEIRKAVEAELNPPVNKVGKKKNSGTRRGKDADVDMWFKNTEEDALKDYDKAGNWTTVKDFDDKTVIKEQMKKYNVGDNDPRDGADGVLTKTLVKYQYKAVVRGDKFADATDETRCCGAVGWKTGIYGSKYAEDLGFKGAIKNQCVSKRAGDTRFCGKCKVDYFDTANKYGKDGAIGAWCKKFGDDVIKQI
jgi:hypothetical protein